MSPAILLLLQTLGELAPSLLQLIDLAKNGGDVTEEDIKNAMANADSAYADYHKLIDK